jgi:hypothetical protein
VQYSHSMCSGGEQNGLTRETNLVRRTDFDRHDLWCTPLFKLDERV